MAWRNHEDPTILLTDAEHDALSELDQIKYYQTDEEITVTETTSKKKK
jgi:hypothetical protein